MKPLFLSKYIFDGGVFMALLDIETIDRLKGLFDEIQVPVSLFVFAGDTESDKITKQLMKDIDVAKDKVRISIYESSHELAKNYVVEHTPAIVIANENVDDLGIRYYGTPAGHEFGALVQAILMAGSRDAPATSSKVMDIDMHTTISIFVTPKCPYCPQAVLTAFKIALVNPFVKAEAIMANDFEQLSSEYGVSSVPHVVINKNKNMFFVGSHPEPMFIEHVVKLSK